MMEYVLCCYFVDNHWCVFVLNNPEPTHKIATLDGWDLLGVFYRKVLAACVYNRQNRKVF